MVNFESAKYTGSRMKKTDFWPEPTSWYSISYKKNYQFYEFSRIIFKIAFGPVFNK